MKKILPILFSILCFSPAQGQNDKTSQIKVFIGAHYNESGTAWMPTTGIGLFLEPSIITNDKFKLGYRFEPTALAYGVLVLPGGCGGECKEGANYLKANKK